MAAPGTPTTDLFIYRCKQIIKHFLKITYTIAAETCYSRMFILWILSCTFSFMHAIHIISIDQIFLVLLSVFDLLFFLNE